MPSSDWVDARFSYLLGCHRRFGNGAQFKFANAQHKVDLIIGFLEQLGCPRIQREWMTRTVPGVTWIRFEPTDALAQWLGIDAVVDF